jgi:hypothetical protein
MEQLYLTNCIYESEKERVVSYFSKDPYKQYDFIFKEKFHPFFYIDIPKEIANNILSDFKKDMKIEKEKNNLKITARNKEVLNKCYKILSFSTSKKILLIDVERQYLLEKEWSYYDLFVVISRNRVKKIETNNVSSVVKKYISPFLKEEQIKIIEKLTRNFLLCNILKIKSISNINNNEIVNTLFENIYFRNKLNLENNSQIEYKVKDKEINQSIKVDFSNVWPYFLTKEFYNIGPETINCNCCKPKKISEINVLSNSLVEVKFKRNGFYFLSKDSDWSYFFHKKNIKTIENRLNYKKNNKLKEFPTGPFYLNQLEKIPLIDAIKLFEEREIEITSENYKINWYCLKKESYLSKIINNLLTKLKIIEKSINLSTSITYNSSFKNKLEHNPLFIQYITEYKLINDLIEEIPRFLEHKNTKFYNPLISNTIKYIKFETIQKIDVSEKRYLIEKDKIIFKEKKFIEKINNYFPKINLPVPRLIIN